MAISSDQGKYDYSNYKITHDNRGDTYTTWTFLLLALIKKSLRLYPRHCQQQTTDTTFLFKTHKINFKFSLNNTHTKKKSEFKAFQVQVRFFKLAKSKLHKIE